MRQREQLKLLKNKGQTGYFYLGQLQIREHKKDFGASNRIFRRADDSKPLEMRDIASNCTIPDGSVHNDVSSNMSVETDMNSSSITVENGPDS